MLKVLFCSLKRDYGNPKAGISLEYKTLYDSLRQMDGVEASFFGMDEVMAEKGQDGMNRELIRLVEETKPDLLFCCLFTDQLDYKTIEHITKYTKTKTFNWFADDHWRVPIYSRYWAPLFTAVSTTDTKALAQYKRYGINNVLYSQWAANHFLYKPQNYAELTEETRKIVDGYGVTFFGQKYGLRGYYMDVLTKAGLPAVGHGRNWPAGGGETVEEMLNIYSFSKINLNFSETPYHGLQKQFRFFATQFVTRNQGKYKFTLGHPLAKTIAAVGTQRRTIKARVFEVPACGGFLLTGESDEPIEKYYEPGKEIVVFKNEGDLVEKCRYYLEHEDERKAIAKAGYERTLKDNTYVQRFTEIFKFMHLM